MKRVLALLLLGSLLLLVHVHPVSADTALSDRTIYIKCDTTRVPGTSLVDTTRYVDPWRYTFGDTTRVTWAASGGEFGTLCADSVKVVFGLSNPWYSNQAVTFSMACGGSATSAYASRQGDFTYKVIWYIAGVPIDTVEAEVILVGSSPAVPSLSTWAVLILVLAVLAVSVGLLRRRRTIVT